MVDNRAIAHGRRPYESGDPRVMWRKNYVGNLRMQRKWRWFLVGFFFGPKMVVFLLGERLMDWIYGFEFVVYVFGNVYHLPPSLGK